MSQLSKGRIPHRLLRRWPVHVIYRLQNSIPKTRLWAQTEWYEAAVLSLKETFPKSQTQPAQQEEYEKRLEILTHRYEREYDHLLDHFSTGPRWLQRKEIATLVEQSWLDLQKMGRVKVLAYCVMSTHVHVILQSYTDSETPLGDIIGSHKKYTGRRANRLLGREGVFWESDYFDRDVRVGKLPIVLDYILNNPVQAGLVTAWEDWPHSYMHPEIGEDYFG